MEPHYNNPINSAGLDESECAARCCYSENPGPSAADRMRERGSRWNNNKIKGGGRREEGQVMRGRYEQAAEDKCCR